MKQRNLKELIDSNQPAIEMLQQLVTDLQGNSTVKVDRANTHSSRIVAARTCYDQPRWWNGRVKADVSGI